MSKRFRLILCVWLILVRLIIMCLFFFVCLDWTVIRSVAWIQSPNHRNFILFAIKIYKQYVCIHFDPVKCELCLCARVCVVCKCCLFVFSFRLIKTVNCQIVIVFYRKCTNSIHSKERKNKIEMINKCIKYQYLCKMQDGQHEKTCFQKE